MADDGARKTATHNRALAMATRNVEIATWNKKDFAAQAYIVKYLGASEQTHVRHCQNASEMWESLEKHYKLKGQIEIANASARLSTIIMSDAETLVDYVKRL